MKTIAELKQMYDDNIISIAVIMAALRLDKETEDRAQQWKTVWNTIQKQMSLRGDQNDTLLWRKSFGRAATTYSTGSDIVFTDLDTVPNSKIHV